MARRAIPVGEIQRMPVPDDPPGPDQAALLLAVPSDEDMVAIENALESYVNPRTGEVRHQTATAVRVALVRCLRGWENILDEASVPIPFDRAIGRTEGRRGNVEKALDLLEYRTKIEALLFVQRLGHLSPAKKG
jgi:uncharacterized protein with PhoU and TrkA domain